MKQREARYELGDRVRVNPKLLRRWIDEGYGCPRSVVGIVERVRQDRQMGFMYIVGLLDGPIDFRGSYGFDEHELRKVR